MNFIQYASSAFAIVAALLWFMSAVKTPERFSIEIIKLDTSFSGESAGTSYHSGHGHSNELDELANKLRWHTTLNHWAAISTGVSAFLQGVGISLLST